MATLGSWLIIILIFLNIIVITVLIYEYTQYNEAMYKEHPGCPTYTCTTPNSKLNCGQSAYRYDGDYYYCSSGTLNPKKKP